MNEAKKETSTAPGISPKNKSSKKLLIAVVVIAALLVIVGIIAAATGLFSGKSSSGSEDISGSAALQSDEYKAAEEYNLYLENLPDEEMDEVIDTSEDAVYDAPDKVKELSQKYNLKYASKVTALTSYDQIDKELRERNLAGIFSEDLDQALKETIQEYEGGYALDDGSLYLEMEQTGAEKEKSTVFISINISPKGVFPWRSYLLNPTEDEDDYKAPAKTFNCKVKKGGEFACMASESEGTAFGKIGDYYLFMDISKDLTEEESQDQEKLLDEIDAKVKKELGMETLDELEEKVYSGSRTAWEKEADAMQEALDNDDTAQYQALQKKYSTASEKEIALYEECSKELEKYDQTIAVTKEVMEEYLNKLDFSKFV